MATTVDLVSEENATSRGENFTAYITEIETKTTQYEQLLADVWVGVVLSLLLLSCVCCMCSCLLYHKFQQWKRSVLRNGEEPEMISTGGVGSESDSLPSYSIASGLPSYEEALRQLEAVDKSQQGLPRSVSKISVFDYLQTLVHEKI